MDHPQGILRTGDRATVTFEFIAQPEYIKEGMKLLFREGKTKVRSAAPRARVRSVRALTSIPLCAGSRGHHAITVTSCLQVLSGHRAQRSSLGRWTLFVVCV